MRPDDDALLTGWLAEEVWELFQSGAVGLYEFVVILNSPGRPDAAVTLSDAEKTVVATAALDELLGRGGYELRWTKWARDFDKPAARTDVAAKEWEIPTDAPYLVISERGVGPR